MKIILIEPTENPEIIRVTVEDGGLIVLCQNHSVWSYSPGHMTSAGNLTRAKDLIVGMCL